ncbi:uncharacterized protein HMPREF1541_00966 [Cyphellophora europaea CBS 101466]|uniref:Non-structural maintenance of chromosomes element 1 homolog n=1 Tax=Cyphellophora europaea (strain CBS 101466) TaxID=1220924 RepID=W2SDK6_CYPE1|nr:uncharacterized protein HMPREF1541_00966 [Cyphellophora europaea CBS 101466]ETN46777.1 hypothetical protein HMPREF1541_00966 [Cyphellophora europaea CBS 101466]
MADLLVPGYNDANRAFLQALLARNTLTWETAKPLLAVLASIREGQNVSSNDITQDDLDAYISKTNMALSPLDMEIRSTLHQLTRERIYALVNTTSDPIMQLATTYSADEIAFVKKMLDAMFDGAANRGKNELMCLSGIQVVQLAKNTGRRETQGDATQPNQPRLTGHEAEELVRKLEAEGWLEKSESGFYTLSARALMELKGWLVETYNEDEDGQDGIRLQKIKFCHACKEIITVGQRCPQSECPCRLHDICTQNFFRSQRSRTCPLCKTEWDGKSYVGERVVISPDRQPIGGRSRRSTGRGARANGDNNESDDHEDMT